MSDLSKQKRQYNFLYLFVLVALPLMYHPGLIDGPLILRQVLLTLFLAVLIVKIYSDRKRLYKEFSIIFTTPVILILSFGLWGILTSFGAINSAEAYYTLSKYWILIGYFIITLLLLRTQLISFRSLRNAAALFIALSLIIGFGQMWEIGSFFDRRYVTHITGNFGHKNLYSSVLFLALPFIIISSLEGVKIIKWLNLALLACTLLFLTYLRTRGVWAGIYIAFTAYIIVLALNFNKDEYATAWKHKRKSMGFIFSIFLLFIILTLTEYKSGWTPFQKSELTDETENPLTPRYVQNEASNTATLETRLILWNKSLSMASQHPIFGVGPGNWKINFPNEGTDFLFEKKIHYMRPHNDFIWILTELGFPGLVLYFSIFSITLYYLIRLIRFGNDATKRTHYIVLFVSIIGYLFIAFVDFPLERIPHQMLLLLLFAYATSEYHLEFKMALSYRTYARNIFLGVLGLSILGSGLISTYRFQSELSLKRTQKAFARQRWSDVRKEGGKAINMFFNLDPSGIPIEWFIGVACYSEGNYRGARDHFENAYSAHPYHVQVLNNLGSAFAQTGNQRRAISTYKEAVRISKNVLNTKLNLTALYHKLGNIDSAYYWIDQCEMESQNEKYLKFLPIILQEFALKSLSSVDTETENRLKTITSKRDYLVELYFKSKEDGEDFITLVKNEIAY